MRRVIARASRGRIVRGWRVVGIDQASQEEEEEEEEGGEQEEGVEGYSEGE